MKSGEVYNAWVEQKRKAEVGENFTEKVMNQVYQYEKSKPKPMFGVQRLVEFISAHASVQTAMITAGAFIGFIRLALMLHVLLYT